MRRFTLVRAVTVGVAASVIMATTATATPASATSVTTSEVLTALAQTQGVATPASSSQVKADKNGVTFGALKVSLPNADKATGQVRAAKGVTMYPSRGDSANAVVPTTDGVQMLTVISSRKAASTYAYDMGGKVSLRSDGGAFVFDKNGRPAAVIKPAWAKDAKGRLVKTHYAANGNTLTQVVEHKSKGVTYPVVADPHVARYWDSVVITLNRSEMAAIAYGGSQALIPMLMVPGVGWALIAAVLYMSGSAAWAYANRQCFWFYFRVLWPPSAGSGTYAC